MSKKLNKISNTKLISILIKMEEQRMFKILTENRSELGNFLKENYSYEYLRNLLDEIEKDKGPTFIKKLFLGNIGFEFNKQHAIYELPTRELILTIKFICDFLNIKNIEELGAGMGLLSCLLKFELGDNYNVCATDGKRWSETSSSNKYYPITGKLFLNYCLDHSFSFDDKLMIISWLPLNDISDILNLICRLF